MVDREIESFEDFWRHYVVALGHPLNRSLHYAGTSMATGCGATAVLTANPAWLLVAPVVGYGPAWIGHFLVEGNKPATFGHPLWSLKGDFKMLGMAIRGKMRDEVERVCANLDTRSRE